MLATAASACATPSSTQAVASSTAGTRPAGPPAASRVGPAPVVLILMENHSYGQIAGSASAPYLNRFAQRGTSFTHMSAVSHPSLPNYLAITSGSTLGCTSDACPPRSFRSKNIFEQLRATGGTWRSWEESMPGRCVVHNASPYAVRHNPAAYFRDLFPRDCPRHDHPYPRTLPRRLPDLTFVTPNLCHDMHDCSVATGDRWLHNHVPQLLALGAVVVITFDEGEGSNHIFCAARGPGIGHAVRRASFTHYGLLGGIERHFGLRRLRRAATARPVPL
ncbi:MAG: alkaline phosphatase family protein [Actinomycetota bacterium]|nr:alkaline phosphatase family protein [Actinomycetota bacterium]